MSGDHSTTVSPSVYDLVTKTKPYVGFLLILVYELFLKKLLNERKFREHRLSDIHTLLKRAKKKLCAISKFFHRFGTNRKSPRDVFEQE